MEEDKKKELGYVTAQQAAAKKERPVQLMDHRILTPEYAMNAHVRVHKILMCNFEQSSNYINVSHVRLFHIFNFLLHLVDCEWAAWEEWMECTATCGGGSKMRTRRTLTCTNALSCKGSFIEQKICSTESCPDLSTLKADVATLKTDGKNINE